MTDTSTAPTAGPEARSLLEALDDRARGERALSPDGETWLTVGDLLDRARGERPPHRAPVAVSGEDPVAAATGLLAAQERGCLPLVGTARLGRLDGAGRLLGRVRELAAGTHERLLVVVTSGTQGRPRAVVRTAASWDASLPGVDALLGEDAGPGTVTWVPGAPSATLALFALWHALSTGRPLVAPGRWRAGSAGTAGPGAGRNAEVVQGVPTVVADVLDARAAGLLPRLRRAVVAGAVVTDGLRRRAAAVGVSLAEYYGAAELSFVAADTDGTGLRAFPGARVQIRRGVIWVRSPYLSRGYLEPDPTGALRRDAAGWASVGDLGDLGPDGVLRVTGRGDGTATVGGTTVGLGDVERALADAEGVAELVALAEPDGRLGERVVAVVRPVGTAEADRVVATLRDLARRGLPAAARPVRFVVRTELPRLPSGKVARADLLGEVLRDRAAPAADPAGAGTRP
ncbi:MAG TPA: fatty acid--CoA ligase family protein [Kineosporiaceae bacterium]